VNAYTLREAADALGKSYLTVRAWAKNGLFPKSILTDTTYNYDQYSQGELEAIVGILDEHFRKHSQLQKNHTEVCERLQTAMDEYREEYI